jgi:hypothetical protein
MFLHVYKLRWIIIIWKGSNNRNKVKAPCKNLCRKCYVCMCSFIHASCGDCSNNRGKAMFMYKNLGRNVMCLCIYMHIILHSVPIYLLPQKWFCLLVQNSSNLVMETHSTNYKYESKCPKWIIPCTQWWKELKIAILVSILSAILSHCFHVYKRGQVAKYMQDEPSVRKLCNWILLERPPSLQFPTSLFLGILNGPVHMSKL